MGEERDKEGGAASTQVKSRGCPANLAAILPLKKEPADLWALGISLETHDLPNRSKGKYVHTHFTEEKAEAVSCLR